MLVLTRDTVNVLTGEQTILEGSNHSQAEPQFSPLHHNHIQAAAKQLCGSPAPPPSAMKTAPESAIAPSPQVGLLGSAWQPEGGL